MAKTNLSTPGLNLPAYDYVSNTYVGANLTETEYRIGGATGIVVATLTFTYDGNGNVLTVTKS